ncbi:endo-1,4-beta-xylanase [[Clostridium] polysaccharolyticum]|uniref:Beta-xylanase n=1 Tax=[Clostridium] polysaccharolyticum TaxID=29364 RepID=A0A1I0G4I5_9FIRM|nr:endo-1,4-beta-xylanase [[Clostridium] polysaccharolyticum]SET65748.1 Endo-1,4-beta-xylanase, GH35 family [[Clostridium] polysaccharolyticum]
MKKMQKQLLSFVVAFAMVLTMFVPFQTASAASTKTYDFSKLSYATGWYSSYYISGDALNVTYDELYGEVKFTLPETLDMSNCDGVSFKVTKSTGELAFKLYNTAGDEVAVKYNFATTGTCTFVPDCAEKVNCIGIMSQTDGSMQATVSSVAFDMGDKVSAEPVPVSSDATLLNTYGKTFGKIGSCVTPNQLSNSNTLNAIKKQYNSVTMENEMKPDAVIGYDTMTVAQAKAAGYYIPSNYKESVVPKLNFNTMDSVMKTCYQNGLKLRAHTLVWHSQTPDRFFKTGFQSGGSYVSQAQMDARMEMYIKTIMHHVYDSQYGSVVYAWDVANEYFHANNSGWQIIYGSTQTLGSKPGFIKKAFQFAHETLVEYGLTDSVSLFYNDYNTYIEADKIVALINWMNQEEKICDGVGMQSHLDTSYPSVSLYKSTMQQFANEGFEIQVTELDVTCKSTDVQAQYYYDLMKAILSLKKKGANITSITYWGLYDSVSWRSSQSPLIFSSLTSPKKAYTQVLQAYVDSGIEAVPSTEPSVQPSVQPSVVPSVQPSVVPSVQPSVEPSAVPSVEPSVQPSAVPSVEPSVQPSAVPSVAPSKNPVSGVIPVVTVKSQIAGGINQNYTISAAGSDEVDLSKVTIRYNYTKSGDKKQMFWCDNAGLQMSRAPYYVNIAPSVKAVFKDGCVEVSFDCQQTLKAGDSLAMGVRLTQEDWSSYSAFVENGYEVYYDGALVSSNK